MVILRVVTIRHRNYAYTVRMKDLPHLLAWHLSQPTTVSVTVEDVK